MLGREENRYLIYITGDCHGDFRRFNTKNFPEQKDLSKNDYVIICGDFGGVWNKDEESPQETFNMDWLENKPFTTLFVDGNHENFDRLYSYPVEEWNGGNIHRIRDSIIHLMRGQVFVLDGKTFFTFGGASSHDIDGGILDVSDPDYHKKRKYLDREWIPYRINHISWWERELPDAEEMAEGIRNIASYNNTVDFIVTHCCSSSTQAILRNGKYVPDRATKYLEDIKQSVNYKKWFFGHYHDNKNINDKEIVIYEQIIRIS